MLKGLFVRRRSKSGFSIVLLILGGLGCLSSLLAVGLGTPMAFANARQVAALPQPAPDALAGLALGEQALFVGQLPDSTATGPFSLYLYYFESEVTTTSESGAETTRWVRIAPPPEQVTVYLSDGAPLTVRLPADVAFLNAHRYDAQSDTDQEGRRYVGYHPLTTLTIEGTWQGEGRVLAQQLYAGSAESYLRYLRAQPGQLFMSGMFCGGLALILLLSGALLALMGK